ncbi:MAG: hypothetical protein SXV54_03045 [Chloroflexota bacterium]|nr:hypothetical protein [Chloroflexota bacterium]
MDFAQVERKVAQLRQELAAGRLTEEQFKARLREMMVQDKRGNWWMVGYETGEWYRHDGSDWVRADPPGYAAPEPTPQPVVPPARVSRNSAFQSGEQTSLLPKPQLGKGIVVFLLGLVISVALGWGLAALTFSILHENMGLEYDLANAFGFACWGIVGLGGIIQSILVAQKVWRGK